MKAMPEVLRLLGEAAQVDRTALAFAELGPNGEKWLKIQAEWISETVRPATATTARARTRGTNRAPTSSASMLMAGKSVVFCPEDMQRLSKG